MLLNCAADRAAAPCPSGRHVEFLAAPRRVSLPAAASRTMPVELARLEAAVLAAVARDALRMAVYQILDQLHVAAALGPHHQQLGVEQPIEAEQRLIAAQLVAHQLVRRLRP